VSSGLGLGYADFCRKADIAMPCSNNMNATSRSCIENADLYNIAQNVTSLIYNACVVDLYA
jgi:hypothetical protein